ncbi:MAG: ASPIC/UnbV domain-containing protein, partial [Verrucomicrobiales bacterium]|nr:ASPIC/UnbV domain-containing protein [Verrucomicrobiales bacterium]
AYGARVRIRRADGSWSGARELHGGGGYWSQDSATVVLREGGDAEAIEVRWPGGLVTTNTVASGVGEVTLSMPGSTP